MSTNFPSSLDTFPSQATLAAGTLAQHSNRHANLGDAVAALEAKVGVNSSTVEASQDRRIYRVSQIGNRTNVCRGIPELAIGAVLPTNSAATNTTNLQAMIDAALTFSAPTSLAFPPQAPGTTYPLNAISVGSALAPVIFEGMGSGASVLDYRGSSAGAAFITFTGTETAGWGNGPGGRIWYGGLRNLGLVNGGSQADSTGVSFFACTHMYLEDVSISDFRRHGVRGRNLADCYWPNVGLFRCGSLNGNGGTNYRAIDYSPSGTGAGKWAVDRIQHVGWQVEDFGDGVLSCTNKISGVDQGVYVNKLAFDHCKFESSGSKNYIMGGDTTTGSVIFLENTDGIVFSDQDITANDLRTGQATLPALFDLDGWCNVQWHGGPGINLGDGAVDTPFTYLWNVSDAHSTVVHNGMVIGADDAAAYPTNVIRFGAAARYAYYGCGWKGDPPATPPTWASGTSPTALLSNL